MNFFEKLIKFQFYNYVLFNNINKSKRGKNMSVPNINVDIFRLKKLLKISGFVIIMIIKYDL